jgi:hypothetical protein
MPEHDTICPVGSEYTTGFFEEALKRSEGGQAIWKELEGRGFAPMREEGRLVNFYSPDDKQSLAIGLIPFISEDRTSSAGLSLSQGGFAKAVSVETEGRAATRFTTYDFFRGKVRVDDYEAERLLDLGAERFSEETEQRRAEKPLVELSVEQARSITQLVYGGPTAGEYPNAKLAVEIGALVQLQTVGSPGCSCSSTCGCCCSCCCSCCW